VTGAVENPLTQNLRNNGRSESTVNHNMQRKPERLPLQGEKMYFLLNRGSLSLDKGLLMGDLLNKLSFVV
jgi:hypothetical protein